MGRALLVAVIVLVFALGEGFVAAYPAVSPPETPVLRAATPSTLIARRRRRRGRRHRPRRRRKRRKHRPVAKKLRKAPRAPARSFPRRDPPAKAASGTSAPPPSADGALRRGARVEFDGRLVQGQIAKSGAIYLFARKRSELKSMVKERSTYRKEILRSVYPHFKVR